MYDLLREGVFYNRRMMFAQNITRDELLAQHRAINAALQARDAKGARRAVEAHLDYVAAAFSDLRRAEQNEAIARQRLEHEESRG